MGGGSGNAIKLPQIRTLLLTAAVVLLAGVVGFALQRELASKPPSAAPLFTAGLAVSNAVPLSAEEEVYAAALWPIHSEVKLAAVRMIFAGLHYKTGDDDPALLKEKVQPLTRTFQSAAGRVRSMQPPASLVDAHERYLEAVGLYAFAAREMIKVADDGREDHLVVAQQKSEEASVAILKLSDVLWPGEYKPN